MKAKVGDRIQFGSYEWSETLGKVVPRLTGAFVRKIAEETACGKPMVFIEMDNRESFWIYDDEVVEVLVF